DRRPVVAAGSPRRGHRVPVHDTQAGRGNGTRNESSHAARVRARDDLSRHARAADDDPAAETYVDTRRRKISVWPVDTESELADRVRPVRRRTLKAPGIALDLHDRVVGARDDTVESRAHGPAID